MIKRILFIVLWLIGERLEHRAETKQYRRLQRDNA
jgi:hypothetical protein